MDAVRKAEELKKMERVWQVFTHPFYVENLRRNIGCEENRIFCRHNMSHFLDVARLAYILNLERGYHVEKEIIYTTALLHDIGKWEQYEHGTPHEVASAKIAEVILDACGFEKVEKENIVEAIQTHRKGNGSGKLAEILYEADKLSRPCFACEARIACNWSEDKKNKQIGW